MSQPRSRSHGEASILSRKAAADACVLERTMTLRVLADSEDESDDDGGAEGGGRSCDANDADAEQDDGDDEPVVLEAEIAVEE